ncbi:MAG: DEAD/DEAH box helicase family protein [Thermodesulfobacteriota bacterium]|nr:MAG: DEAD/DEAH box helicase family protein [Thermodesulfobacteriota bacterium]
MSRKCIFKTEDFEYQTLTANYLVKALLAKSRTKRIRGAVLGDGVGMGKTYTSLFTAFSYMSNAKPYLKDSRLNRKHKTSLLIVAPNDIVMQKWISEIEPYAKPGNFSSYIKRLGNGLKIKDKLLAITQNINTTENLGKKYCKPNWSVIVTTRGKLKRLDDNRLQILKTVTGFIIFDEAHRMKEPSFKQAFENNRYLSDLVLGRNHPKFLFLTATPFQKNIGQMKTLFSGYFLGREDWVFKDLNDYVVDVGSYLRGAQEKSGKLKVKKRELEKELRQFFVINKRLKKLEERREEYVNGALCSDRSAKCYVHLFNEDPKLEKKWYEFQTKYLSYRFESRNGRKSRVEQDLTRFTSFVTEKHKKIVGDNYPLKCEMLGRIIARRFLQDRKKWNRKFIIFCDMLNDNVSHRDGKLHERLRDACVRTIEGFFGKTRKGKVPPPNLERVIASVVLRTRVKGFRDVFYSTRNERQLRASWTSKIDEWQKRFNNSLLYSFYGEDIKAYYERLFREMIGQYACIEFLRKKMLSGSMIPKKRKAYIKSLFGSEGIGDKSRWLLYTEEDLNDLWALYYGKHQKSVVRRKSLIENTKRDIERIFKKELKKVLRQWDEALPGKELVSCYNGSSKNAQDLKRFQWPLEPCALVLSKACEEGVDLQAFTSGVIHYDFDWSPGRMVQREGRVDRIGRAIDKKGVHKIFAEKKFKSHLDDRHLQFHYLVMPNTYDERKFVRMTERRKLFKLLVPVNLEDEYKSFHTQKNSRDITGLSFDLSVRP